MSIAGNETHNIRFIKCILHHSVGFTIIYLIEFQQFFHIFGALNHINYWLSQKLNIFTFGPTCLDESRVLCDHLEEIPQMKVLFLMLQTSAIDSGFKAMPFVDAVERFDTQT